jgi:hypothetical protein
MHVQQEGYVENIHKLYNFNKYKLKLTFLKLTEL